MAKKPARPTHEALPADEAAKVANIEKQVGAPRKWIHLAENKQSASTHCGESNITWVALSDYENGHRCPDCERRQREAQAE